jgi:squalene-associated FAD-dependent desaturase
MSFDVIVIGGGLSGLAASVELASQGSHLALFEQAPKLGGRCYSYIDQKTGDVVDNGQHVLLGAYHHSLRYLEMIGTREFLKQERSLSLPLHHPEKGFAAFNVSSLPKPFHLTAGILKFKLLSFADRQKLLKVGLALTRWNAALEASLATQTIEVWLKSLNQSERARNCLWYPLAISIMNEVPERASALLFARSLRAAFMGTKQDSAILIPTIGQTELYVERAQKLLMAKKATVCTNTEVASIRVKNDAVVGVVLKNGKTFNAQSVISTIPCHAFRKILPHDRRNEPPFHRLHEFESSPIISIHLWFDAEFMEMDYVGLIEKNIQWLFNRRRIIKSSTKKGSYLTGVISGAHTLIDSTKEELVALALKDIHAVFPVSNKVKLIHSIVIKEKRATFSPTISVEKVRPSTETPIRNFYLAGDWTNTGLPATIEGAVMSGFNAAHSAKD